MNQGASDCLTVVGVELCQLFDVSMS
jgi:hypothetical protein